MAVETDTELTLEVSLEHPEATQLLVQVPPKTQLVPTTQIWQISLTPFVPLHPPHELGFANTFQRVDSDRDGSKTFGGNKTHA
jgi:hypothetical protein